MIEEKIIALGKSHFFFFIGEFIGGILIIIQMLGAIKAISRDDTSATQELIKLSIKFFVI